MHQPHARIRHLKAGNVRAAQASDKSRAAVFSAETNIGRAGKHDALLVFGIEVQSALRINVTYGIGDRKGDPEIAGFIKRDAVGEPELAQKFGTVNLCRSYRVVGMNPVAQDAAFHGFRHINILFLRVHRDAVGKTNSGGDDLRRPAFRDHHQASVGDGRP